MKHIRRMDITIILIIIGMTHGQKFFIQIVY